MKIMTAVPLALSLLTAQAGAAESWLRPSNFQIDAFGDQAIAEDRYFELEAARRAAAETQLMESPIVKLDANGPANYGRPDFACPGATQPYLVRAVFTNHGTGSYRLQRFDNALLVSHGSLGRSRGTHRSALVVCLDFTPAEVFVESGGAI